jgi:hypothetical protein
LAAEKRLATQRKIGKGGVLGGKSVLGRSMKEVVAEVSRRIMVIDVPADVQAAERRIRDDKICHTDSGVQAEVEKAARESEGVDADQLGPANEPAIESITEIKSNGVLAARPSTPSSSTVPQSRPEPARPKAKPKSTPDRTSTPQASSSASIKPQPQVIDLTEDESVPSAPIVEQSKWSCPTCTLLNPVSVQSCEACTTDRPGRKPKPKPKSSTQEGWYCEFCGTGPRDMSYWSCGECGWVRKWG